MLKPVKTILFATNLSESLKPAFEFAVSLAIQYQANLMLLHVIDREFPGFFEKHLKDMIGEEKWQSITQEYEQDARQALIGKMSSHKLIRTALNHYCSEAGLDASGCDYQAREIVIEDENVVETIVRQADDLDCDLIVMGARKGFLTDNSIGPTVKGVLRRSRIPVMVVPPRPTDRKA